MCRLDERSRGEDLPRHSGLPPINEENSVLVIKYRSQIYCTCYESIDI